MRQVILIILDGWGWSKEKTGNAILAAKTPFLDYLKKNYPFFLIQASGRAVGLPPLKEGNSEVGHLTIGAGRIVLQHLTVIDQAIKNGSFFENETFGRLLSHVQNNNSGLHLMGLLTSGVVHASLEHLISIIRHLRSKRNLSGVFIHLFTDGKDSGKKESLSLIERIEKEISGSQIKIASLIGRDFAMDRDNNWELTKKAYRLLTDGIGEKTANPKEAVKNYHSRGITDEMIPPTIITNNLQPITNDHLIEDGDGILFLNFREDSVRQLTRAFADSDFNFFETKKFRNIFFATMTNYGNGLKIKPIFKRGEIKNTLGETLEANGKKQLHLAETAKSSHVTYFFNGLREDKFENETDILIPSIQDYLENPEMKVKEITGKIIEELEQTNYEFLVANLANPDMLSHTGNLEATVRGIEAVDQSIGQIFKAGRGKEAVILITGDHGNAENLTYLGTGEKETRHNPGPVPLYLIGKNFKKDKTERELAAEEKEIKGMLQDIAPTILELMNIKKPPEMTGISLI